MKKLILGLAFVSMFAAATLAAQTLTVWDFKYSEVSATGAQAPMKANDAAFMKAHPGVTIDHVAQPTDNTQYYQIIQSAATAGSGPDVAMFHPGGRVDGFADILVDLDPYIKDVKGQFTTASIEMCSLNEKLGNPVKVLPLTMQGFGFYYNKAYFKKAGLIPTRHPRLRPNSSPPAKSSRPPASFPSPRARPTPSISSSAARPPTPTARTSPVSSTARRNSTTRCSRRAPRS